MRVFLAFLVTVGFVACSGVDLPPTNPEEVRVFVEFQGQRPQEEYENLGMVRRDFTATMCEEVTGSPCDDDEIFDFGVRNLKEWGGKMGADALIVHEANWTQNNSTQFLVSAIYFPARHPELQETPPPSP